MHTYTCGTTTFNFNSDISGEVTIRRPDGAALNVPGGDLVAFVAEYVRQRRFSELESMTALEVLGVKRSDA